MCVCGKEGISKIDEIFRWLQHNSILASTYESTMKVFDKAKQAILKELLEGGPEDKPEIEGAKNRHRRKVNKINARWRKHIEDKLI